MKAALLTLVMIAALAGTDAVFDANQPLPELRTTFVPSPIHILPHERAVIFQREHAAANNMHGWFYGADVDSYWTPLYEPHIAPFEQSLPAYLQATANSPTTFAWDKPRLEAILERGLQSYHVQYVGVFINGEPMIYANHACNLREGDRDIWEREYWAVLDGGSCYFGIFYQPEKHLYTGLNINGEA